jgi:hypothetical protein
VNEPQVWTLIAVFASIMLGVQQWSIGSLRREMLARFDRQDLRTDALESTMSTRFAGVDARFAALDTKIDDRFDRSVELMEARFSDVGHRLGALESDMTLVKGHLIGQRSA